MPRVISVNGDCYGIWDLPDGQSGDAVPTAKRTTEIIAKINQSHGEHSQSASKK